MSNIRNLMFDLGGVIMSIERLRAVKALQQLGMTNANELLGEYGQKDAFLDLELGRITPEQWRAELRRHINADNVTDAQIDDAFTQFLIGIPSERLTQLEELHQHYRIYLLSNTNPVMWHGFIQQEFKKAGHDINYYFDGIVTSFECHAYKPDPAIFQHVCLTYGIKPEETIFFDDSAENVKASEALGFHGVHVTDSTPFKQLI